MSRSRAPKTRESPVAHSVRKAEEYTRQSENRNIFASVVQFRLGFQFAGGVLRGGRILRSNERLTYADFFGYFLVRNQESNTSPD